MRFLSHDRILPLLSGAASHDAVNSIRITAEGFRVVVLTILIRSQLARPLTGFQLPSRMRPHSEFYIQCNLFVSRFDRARCALLVTQRRKHRDKRTDKWRSRRGPSVPRKMTPPFRIFASRPRDAVVVFSGAAFDSVLSNGVRKLPINPSCRQCNHAPFPTSTTRSPCA